MKLFFIRAAGTTVEVWSRYRIQFSGTAGPSTAWHRRKSARPTLMTRLGHRAGQVGAAN
jgi:hypothetical protein